VARRGRAVLSFVSLWLWLDISLMSLKRRGLDENKFRSDMFVTVTRGLPFIAFYLLNHFIPRMIPVLVPTTLLQVQVYYPMTSTNAAWIRSK
jgi:hypothetical protein